MAWWRLHRNCSKWRLVRVRLGSEAVEHGKLAANFQQHRTLEKLESIALTSVHAMGSRHEEEEPVFAECKRDDARFDIRITWKVSINAFIILFS